MKKTGIIALAIITICFISTACAQSAGGENNKNFSGIPLGDDFYYSIIPSKFIETKEAYYGSKGDIIHVTEKDELKWIPLCNKADCNHSDESCNACIHASQIGYWKNAIYYIDGNTKSLCKMDMDGTSHEMVYPLEEYGNGYSLFFHRGYLYLKNSEYSPITPSENYSILRRAPLEADKIAMETVFGSEENEAISYGRAEAHGETLYLFAYEGDKKNLYQYNINTGEVTLFYENWNGEGPEMTHFTEKSMDYFVTGQGFFHFEKGDKKSKLIREAKPGIEAGPSYYDQEYLYLITGNQAVEQRKLINPKERGIRIYDKNLKLVDQLHYPENQHYSYFNATDRYVFFYLQEEDNDLLPNYYIDKKDIGTGKLKMQKVPEN